MNDQESGTDDGSQHDTVQTWLVERSYDDRGLVSLVYATLDGERHRRREVSMNVLRRSPATAGQEFDRADLEPVPESERERYATEAARVSDEHDPEDEI